jgi:hypothetical protein
MLQPPCASWGVANREARALRKRDPWGLSRPSARARELLSDGNLTAKATLRILKCCVKSRVPALLEQPVGSRMRNLPELHAIIALDPHHFTEVCVSHCAFGKPYLKRTWLLLYRCEPSHFDGCSCSGGSVCAFSGEKHHQLIGGRATRAAAAYPTGLCRRLVASLLEQQRADRVNIFLR